MGEDARRALVDALREALAALADPDVAAHSARFFQTGPGGYGVGAGARTCAEAPSSRVLPLRA